MSFAPAACAGHGPGDAAPVVGKAGSARSKSMSAAAVLPGEVVKVKADTAHLHLFDGATGMRVGD